MARSAGFLAARGYRLLFVMNGATGVVFAIVAAVGIENSAWTHAATVAVWTVGEVFGGIVAGGPAADMAPAEAPGRYRGAMDWVSSATRLVAPLLATALFGPGLWWLIGGAGSRGSGDADATLRSVPGTA